LDTDSYLRRLIPPRHALPDGPKHLSAPVALWLASDDDPPDFNDAYRSERRG
jgi:hypothetical protein